MELGADDYLVKPFAVAVRRLRAKVDGDFEPKLIRMVRGMGYVNEVLESG